jgi:hypothetical protein
MGLRSSPLEEWGALHEGFKTTAIKEDVGALRSEMNQKFQAVELRLDQIEYLLQR